MSPLRPLTILLSLHLLALPVLSARAAGSGYFQVQQRDGVWWLISPAGQPMLSAGVDDASYLSDHILHTGRMPYHELVEKKYPSRDAWNRATIGRLRSWGFNTVGAWSDRELWDQGMPYTMILNIAEQSGADWEHGKAVDVYDPRFERMAQEIATKECAPRRQDRQLIGYFSDNELRWGPDWRGKETMLDLYLELPEGAAGREHAIEFLKQRYGGEIAKLNAAWQIRAADFAGIRALSPSGAHQADADQFLGEVADRYFAVCARALHQADPNHLYLGARFAGQAPDPVFRAARVCDVVSINIYGFDPRPLVGRLYELTGKPILVTEFAFRATDSGLPNTKGAGPKVPSQRSRADAYSLYVALLESLPEAIGYHWFKWNDEPKEGRFDGENSNYGLVNIEDEPYLSFGEAVQAANQAAIQTHRASGRP